ncbi:MAG: hypothetical protein U1F65_02235 [Verrucomicrobiota bacterium]
MNIPKYLALGFVGCALLAFAAEENTATQKTYTKAQVKDLLADLEAGNALSSIVVLEALRRGDTQQAIESLEFSVDASMSSIAARLKGQEIDRRSSLYEALAKVKSYRQANIRSMTTNSLGQPFDETQKPVVEKADALLKSIPK